MCLAWSHVLCDTKHTSSAMLTLQLQSTHVSQACESPCHILQRNTFWVLLHTTTKSSPYQIGEIVAILARHQPAWVAEAGDVLNVGLKAWGVALQDNVNERG